MVRNKINARLGKIFVLFILALVLIALIYSYLSQGIIYWFFQGETGVIAEFLERWGVLAVFIFIVLVVVEVVFISIIPSILLYTVGGILFGPIYGSIIIWIGNVLGATACYFLSRTFLKNYFERKIPDNKLETFNKYAERYGHYAIFLIRLNPLTSSDVFSYIAGVTKLKFLPFILGTSLGLIPLIVLVVFFGSEVIASNPYLATIIFVGSIIYISLIAFAFSKGKK